MWAPSELKNCIAATQVYILSSPLQKHVNNLCESQIVALHELQMLQKNRQIVIRRSDKSGGWVICNFDTYKSEGDKKLKETYCENEETKPKYILVNKETLKGHHRLLRDMAEEGFHQGFICEDTHLWIGSFV